MQCEAPKIAKLVYNSNNYGLWYANNYSYWGESKPTNTTGGPHIVDIHLVKQGSQAESKLFLGYLGTTPS
jgi:hypothetical protein